MDILSMFHPLLARWFEERIGRPTDVQEAAWPLIAAGEHVLVTAPTGSGKTLTAFFWAIDRLVRGELPLGETGVLYISPLKALNNDVRRNLSTPLGEISRLFGEAGARFPSINVLTRSGDTPQSDRRRMLRHPPEILITTPESLNLMLGSAGGRSILPSVSTVILDEIHAVAGSKRGVHLMTAVERLAHLSGDFQRIALSATVKPVELMAQWVGGFIRSASGPDPVYSPRKVTVVKSSTEKRSEVRVVFLREADRISKNDFWDHLAVEFKKIIARNHSTLLFVNSRRLCEKLTFRINNGENQPLAYAHHGSLSREIRGEVERKLKSGSLKAIVATNSLELGIDIGSLDQVLMIQSPPSISSAIQRIGRAGHQVGQVSQGVIFPTHPQDLLEAAVLASSILQADIETISPIEAPLDVLAQVIVSMAGAHPWDMDELYAVIKTSYPYRHLGRREFDLVLNMLGGRYAESRIRELKPRISIDRLENTVTVKKGALLALYMSGGTIPDRGYFHMRHFETGAKIGELDEEFVWEARVGQHYTLGSQNWRIERITHNDVLVRPASPRVMSAPFWHGEEIGRDFHFSEAIGCFLEEADRSLNSPDFLEKLKTDHRLEPGAADELIEFLWSQKEKTNGRLPHRHHLLIEHVASGPGGGIPGNQLVWHTFWGGKINRPLAMALSAAWEQKFGVGLEVYAANDLLIAILPHEIQGRDLLSLVTADNVEELLGNYLEGSGFFGARFRECAGRALLLSRTKINERLPLWITRLKSQKLLEAVKPYPDFPILLEAWRSCLRDEFDLADLKMLLAELEEGVTEWSEVKTSIPSPMARAVSFRLINQYMYMTDEPASSRASSLSRELLREVVFNPALRPAIPLEIIVSFEEKRQRLSPGYSPASPQDLLDWLKERLLIEMPAWHKLLAAMKRDHQGDPAETVELLKKKITIVSPREAAAPLMVARETVPLLSEAGLWPGPEDGPAGIRDSDPPGLAKVDRAANLQDDREERLTLLVGEWLQYFGPITARAVEGALGVAPSRLALVLEGLVDSGSVISGRLVLDSNEIYFCDAENFEFLLKMTRKKTAGIIKPLEIEKLPLFLAAHQGLTSPDNSLERLMDCLEQLVCLSLPAELWETEILPARLRPYDPTLLDSVMQGGDLIWVGSEKQRAAFCFEPDLDLLLPEQNGRSAEREADQAPDQPALKALFPDEAGRYDFRALLQRSSLGPSELADRLWSEVFKGRVTNDAFASLRRGLENKFKTAGFSEADLRPRGRRPGGRSGFSRWKSSLPQTGNWRRIVWPEKGGDIMEEEERKKDRVRLLLDRYGLLFRELLAREAPPLRWPVLFRSLRLMELSGEIMAGCFFDRIPGPQFMSRQAFRRLTARLPEKAVYWINAVDPISPCGLKIDPAKGLWPKRLAATHLVFQGANLVLVSERQGRHLTIKPGPDHPDLPSFLGPLHHLLNRGFMPLRRLKIEAINGEPAGTSPYLGVLRTAFDVLADYEAVVLYRGLET